jgi:dTDP-glucose pyrophosphorylase
MTLVIMAAGMGSRFGGLKQIEPVGPNGEFIIDYSVYDAIAAGFNEVVFIIKEENYEVFKETIGKRVDDKIKVTYVFQNILDIPIKIDFERIKPWGTGQAILATKMLLKITYGY